MSSATVICGEASVSLAAVVTAPIIVNHPEGIVTFTIDDAAGATVGTVVSNPVSNGVATATFPLRGLPAGTYALHAHFAPGDGVYAALPSPLKERIAGLKIKHDGTYNSGGYVRQGVTPTDDPLTSPGALHPLVCRHPDTGRRMLYLGRRRNAYLVGLGLAESEALLNELWTFVDRPEFAWEHVWRVGDLVLWDNRCTMHRRDAFDPNSRRIMHRTQVKGEQRPA